jgi:hypothetical protein
VIFSTSANPTQGKTLQTICSPSDVENLFGLPSVESLLRTNSHSIVWRRERSIQRIIWSFWTNIYLSHLIFYPATPMTLSTTQLCVILVIAAINASDGACSANIFQILHHETSLFPPKLTRFLALLIGSTLRSFPSFWLLATPLCVKTRTPHLPKDSSNLRFQKTTTT